MHRVYMKVLSSVVSAVHLCYRVSGFTFRIGGTRMHNDERSSQLYSPMHTDEGTRCLQEKRDPLYETLEKV